MSDVATVAVVVAIVILTLVNVFIAVRSKRQRDEHAWYHRWRHVKT